jgi:hypothetical protein
VPGATLLEAVTFDGSAAYDGSLDGYSFIAIPDFKLYSIQSISSLGGIRNYRLA